VLSGATRVPAPASWSPYKTFPGAACWRAAAAAPPGLNVSALWLGDDADAPALTRARWPNSARGDAPYPSAWSPATAATGLAWAPPPDWQRCESAVARVAAPCFSNFTSQGGMSPCFESRTGCGSLRFEPPVEPGAPRSVCGGAMSALCNTVPGGLAVAPNQTAFAWPFATRTPARRTAPPPRHFPAAQTKTDDGGACAGGDGGGGGDGACGLGCRCGYGCDCGCDCFGDDGSRDSASATEIATENANRVDGVRRESQTATAIGRGGERPPSRTIT
jgi:hypothetical protein